MMIEWECILECNYKCSYCCRFNGPAGVTGPIRYEKDKDKVFSFLSSLKEKYPESELFLFGGEPFVHPFIEDIVSHLNSVGMSYVIQSNFTLYDRMRSLLEKETFPLQISLHPNDIEDEEELLKQLPLFIDYIRRIDVMYVGRHTLDLYKKILPVIGEARDRMYLTPVADFEFDAGMNEHLYDFNKLKNDPVYGRVYNFEDGERSFLWEDQMKGNFSLKGKPCPYIGKYLLFDPQLNSYTCNYRQNNELCPNNHCFLA